MRSSSVRAAAMTIVLLAGFGWMVASTSHATGRKPTRLPQPVLDSRSPADGNAVVFAGGCFWGVQAVFEHVKGVTSATAGYAGGPADAADYEDVSTGTTGHAESVRVVFDPAVVSFGELLDVFFSVAHDPTELNQQGPDVGSQYRSAIFFTTAGQERIARAYIEQLSRARTFDDRIVTQVVALQKFYPAEAYHQDYVKHHPDQPYVAFNDLPKLAKLREAFPQLYH